MKLPPIALAAALAVTIVTARVQAAPAMPNLPVAPSYLGFVGSADTATFDGDAFQKQREKLGSPMSIITYGEARAREMRKGYVTVFATWAQTTLRVPLGWYAVESNENVDESLVFSPGQTVQIVARAAIENSAYQADRDEFAKIKAKSVEQTRARLQKMGLKAATIERTDAPDGESFVVSAAKATDKAGRPFSYLERFSQRSNKAERDAYWAKRAKGEPLSSLQLPLAMSLLAPSDKFEKYLPLFGLMARDEGLNWATENSLSSAEFAAQTPHAAQFEQVAAEAVALLAKGDAAAFQARFPEAFAGQSKAEITRYLTQIAVPFFATLPAATMRESVTVTRDRDPIEPLLRATIRRDFEVGKENFPSYVVAMERINGKIQLLGVATTSDEFPA